MKTIKLLMPVSLLWVMSFVFYSCEKNQASADEEQTAGLKCAVEEYCGTVATVDFLAGQHILAGSVTVGNDAENLYVTYKVENGWLLKMTHLYVGDCEFIPVNKQKNPQIGQFPYSRSYSPFATEDTYVIPLSKLPNCMCVAAHAEVVKLNEAGEVIQAETAWGKGDDMGGKSWAMKFEYCKRECVTEPPQECYGKGETAWTFGPEYAVGGNWAMYTPYMAGGEVDIYAGQKKIEGAKAVFSAVNDGMVTITITLNNWALQNVSESVKIEGYATAPIAEPSPGLFTYKGTALTVTVPAYAFYGIHLDVMPIIPCEE